MLWYSIRRFNLFIITLLILTIVGFSLLRLDPASPWLKVGFWHGWMLYLNDLVHLNFGISKAGIPIVNELAVVFPATLELCTIAFLMSVIVGIPIGTLAGMKQGKWIDTIISFISMSGYSAPIYWVALLLIMAFLFTFKCFPFLGATTFSTKFIM